ncbi:hypothetical protein M8J76_014620 [Diaphorina citri]|nr:hypothetical protein M8J75_011285 [Diaphorina citri]KAI5737549.1 hypothetical protein M8J76_014620 [Diaphorina citri]KAI5744026.1 hypothetical protein M8J77_024896 [Diaphorina citri]
MVRHNNQLPNNLPQLQNLIKRDPVSYKDEFLQQQRHFESLLSVFCLQPSKFNKSLDELIMFMAQVAQCYPDSLSCFAQQLMDVLNTHNTILDANMRMTFCKALILLRNKGLLTPIDLLPLFFGLLRCPDKPLRKFLETHIITDIKNINAKHKNAKLNTTLQNFMYEMLKDSNHRAAKMSLSIMVHLYKKTVWRDAKTVNVISTACFSKSTKVMTAALKFFLTADEAELKSDDDDSDDEDTIKGMKLANKYNKKTKKRANQLDKAKKNIRNKKNRKQKDKTYHFSALQLIHDPQGLAEKLFNQLEKRHERFEVKLMCLDVISRLIGLHKLFLFNFYPYVQRFLQPHQREVTRLMQFVAQASHDLVPPDVLEPVLRALVNNFVTERNSSDAMAMGLNAIRELCSRCPLVMNQDLLQDLVQYKNYREKSVMMAARALLHLYRVNLPTLLHRRDRGRPTEASIELKVRQYGEIDAKEYVPGAEVLSSDKAKPDDLEPNQDDDSDSDSWVDLSDNDADHVEIDSDEDSDEEMEEDDEDGSSDEEEGVSDADDSRMTDEVSELDDSQASQTDLSSIKTEEKPAKDSKTAQETGEKTGETSEKPAKPKTKLEKKKEKSEKMKEADVNKEAIVQHRKALAEEISCTRILTDEDFKRIESAQAKKMKTGFKALQLGKKRKHNAALEQEEAKGELVDLGDIENIYKRKKHDKETRLESVMKGREGRAKWGYQKNRANPHASTTNKEKKKDKNFMMVRHKVRGKIKRSFKDKQIALRNHLIKQRRMK